MEEEIWKDIPGFEGLYQASTFGRIKSLSRISKGRYGNDVKRKPTILSGRLRTRYLYVVLYKDNIKYSKAVHRLIGLTFHINPENKSEINHKDGNRFNNRADNLEWNTHQENCIHIYKTGLKKTFAGYKKGEGHTNSKLTEIDVLEIRRLYSTGNYTQKEIGQIYNISRRNIGDIVNREVWKHI